MGVLSAADRVVARTGGRAGPKPSPQCDARTSQSGHGQHVTRATGQDMWRAALAIPPGGGSCARVNH